jgi:transposase-like protein
MGKTTNKYSPEVRERAVRMVMDSEPCHAIDEVDGARSRHRNVPHWVQ